MVTVPFCAFLLLRLFFNLVNLLGLCCLLSFYEGSRLNPDVLSWFWCDYCRRLGRGLWPFTKENGLTVVCCQDPSLWDVDTRQQDVGRYGLMIRNIVSAVRCPSDWPPDDLSDRDQILNACSQVTDARPTWFPSCRRRKDSPRLSEAVRVVLSDE